MSELLQHRAPTHAGRRHDDAGISLVEVLVAVTLLAVTMAATASSVVQSLQVARDSRESVVAANVVQYELERLRAIPFVDWVTSARTSGTNGTTTTTATGSGPDGQVYEVTRQATWVQAGAATDGCQSALPGGGGGDGSDYVRVSQTVTFPDRDIDPVTNVTIITPRLDFFDPFTGNLAVSVVDRDGVGSPGHQVAISGPAGLEVALTDANGCAFFSFLPVASSGPATADYDVTIDTPGFVDVESDVQRIEDTAVVAAQSTTVHTYTYDRAATIRPRAAVATLPVPGCTLQQVGTELDPAQPGSDPSTRPTLADGSGGGTATVQALRCLDGGAPVPGWQPTIPLNLGWTVHQPSLTWSATGSQVRDQPGTTVPPAQIDLLFPYADGYSVHAGRCPDHDPTRHGGAQRAVVATDPGGDAAVDVPLAMTTIRVAPAPVGDPQDQPVDVFADSVDPADCGPGERLYLGRTTTGASLQALVPYGTWTVFADRPGRTTRSTPYGCGEDPVQTTCRQLRADQAVDPQVGVVIDVARPA